MRTGVCVQMKPCLEVDGAEITFEAADTPQQENAHDCGVYVLAIADALCAALAEGQQEEAVLKAINASSVRKFRHEILRVIQSKIGKK
ncbi:hypothetical protein CYMTET_23345 [Cymbomonas tetramitiformis]|uniref:Ubiquitin-like protease family profile domain-containing protein n=1 Tax=Cymbomonas tetramitiformis TaxID=36881 RepID=A0AAE0FYL4_9CHLO|nr:hypothetical protein CYMTET_23345 [Cymbomonas tetramitiformis]